MKFNSFTSLNEYGFSFPQNATEVAEKYTYL